MKVIKKINFVLLFCVAKMAVAQNSNGYFHKNNYYDVSLAAGKQQFSEALSWTHLHAFGKKNQVKIGYGLRYTNYNSRNKFYTTAPAELTSTKQNLGTIFSPNIAENIDTLKIGTTRDNFLNITIHLQYSIKKFDFNFNIDAAGVSFGNMPRGNYFVNNAAGNNYNGSFMPKASITGYNLLLTSDNDIGSLNSEFSIRYWFNDKLAVRAGYCFLFSEYTTDNELRLNNDRFRYKSRMALIAITFSPFHN